MPPRYSLGQTIGSVSSKLGNALMQVAQTTEARTNRAYDLARQGRLDGMAMQRIQMDHEMLTESRKRTADLLESQTHARGRAASDIIRGQEHLGYTPQLAEGQTREGFASALGTGQVGQWDFDPATSGAAQISQAQADIAAAEYPETTELIRGRAQALGEDDLSITGQPLTAPRPVPADPSTYITLNGRRFPNTPEGQAAALEWSEQVGDASGATNLWEFLSGSAPAGGTPAVDAGMGTGAIGGVSGAVSGTVIGDEMAQQVIDALNLTGGDASEIAYAISQGADEEALVEAYGRQR